MFYASITDASVAMGLPNESISNHVNHPDKHRQVKGYQFRLATSEEITQKRFINA